MFEALKKKWMRRTVAMQMPKTKAEIRRNVILAKKTWLGVGGPAEFYFEPADEKDLARFIKNRPAMPMTVLGGGSNVLIRENGIPGIVIHLGKSFTNYTIKEDIISCDAGLLTIDLSKIAQKNGLSGFEFLSGIPGSVGGALRMNAGAYGSEIKDILVSIRAVDGNGTIHEFEPQPDFFKYRKNALPEDWIFTGASFRGVKKDPQEILQTMQEFKKKREASQPIGVKTCGSTFKNPDGLTAWKLIEKAGCRGLKKGDAQMSDKHCNFLVNTGKATAKELEDLGEEVRQKVLKKCGVLLDWEVKRLGIKEEIDE